MAERNTLRRRKFPMLGFLLLIIGIVWLLNEMEMFVVDVPWIPVILIVVAAGMVWNRLAR